jgi:hypothetical protein
MSVIFSPSVHDYLDGLIPILYREGYFLSEDSAIKYVEELVDSIFVSLPMHLHKPAPARFGRYGKNLFYATFRKNRHTSWYVFFTKHIDNGETVYLVRYISNNHTTAHLL